MKDCLSEQALLAQYFGEGSESDATHLKSCAVCARGYRLLRQDMEVITTALRTPPYRRAHESRLGSRIIALAMAGAVAVLAVVWLTRHQMPVSATSAGARSAAALAKREVSPGGAQEVASNTPVPVSYIAYLRAAFAGEDGCGQGDSVFNLSCSQNWQPER